MEKIFAVLLSAMFIGLCGCMGSNTENHFSTEGGTTVTVTQEKLEIPSKPEAPAPINFLQYVDFIVEVSVDKDPVVLQLTDPQIVDASQQRTPDRLGDTLSAYWATDQVEARCYQYIRETVQATKPDLIIVTGDLVYGEFDDNGTVLLDFIRFMESFQIPWAPVFGNHDNESAMGVDWQCDQLENASYCLFKQRNLKGSGNYSVGIVQGNRLQRVFYMLDSNGCTGASDATMESRQYAPTPGFRTTQITWYSESIQALKAVSPNTKISFAYHIQQSVFEDAYAKYGFDSDTVQNSPINIDLLANREEGDFGYLGRALKKPWDTDQAIWQGMKALGVDSIFVGHEHCNSASVVYEGVRFQFGQKSSTYDRTNYRLSDGTIVGSYYEKNGTPLVGGSVIPLSKEDGSIQDPYIYLCQNT